VENGTKINRGKTKAIRFTRTRVKNPLRLSLGNQTFPEASSCKYMGIILRSDLNWMDQVNYRTQNAWKALHFVMRVLKEGDRKTKRVAYTSLLRPTVEYESACWDPCRGQKNALDQVQKEAAQFTNPTGKSWLSVGR